MNDNARTRRLLGTGLASVLIGTVAQASPNESVLDMSGVSGSAQLAYGVHTENAALTSAVDTDTFTFSAQAGDAFRLVARSFTSMDPLLTLRDPTGAVVKQATCSYNCSTWIDYAATMSGTYTLNFADNGLDESGSYQLHLDRYPPKWNWVGFGYGATVSDALGHPVDSDYFAFDGAAGTRISISLRSFTSMDPHLQVWDPSGNIVLDVSCSYNCTTGSDDLLLTSSGIYRVGIDDAGWDETGGYALQASCVFGSCPTTIPVPVVPGVPEPATWALMLGGAALLAARARRFTSRLPAST